MALPVYTGRKYFSATLSNIYTDHLLACHDYAIAPRAAFNTHTTNWASSNGLETAWSGYVLYTGDTTTLRYAYTSTGGDTFIYVNGVEEQSGTGAQAGTTTVSGLTANTVYAVRVDSNASSLDLKWLGLTKTINYTAPPNFTNGNALTAANWTTLRTGIAELEQAVDAPQSTGVFAKYGDPGPGRGGSNGVGPAVTVWRGYFYHVHNTLRYKFRYGVNTKTATANIYYNGNNVKSLSDATLDKTKTGVADLSGEGLSIGTIYECYIQVSRSGTAATLEGFMWLFEMTEAGSLAITPPPVWAHGGQNVSDTNMDRYSTIIDAIHPAAAAPTAPLVYEQPVVRTPTSRRFYIQHRKRWLRYRPYANNTTCELSYGPNFKTEVALPSTAGNHTYDLSQLPGLVPGGFYWLDDCDFAQEHDQPQ